MVQPLWLYRASNRFAFPLQHQRIPFPDTCSIPQERLTMQFPIFFPNFLRLYVKTISSLIDYRSSKLWLIYLHVPLCFILQFKSIKLLRQPFSAGNWSGSNHQSHAMGKVHTQIKDNKCSGELWNACLGKAFGCVHKCE